MTEFDDLETFEADVDHDAKGRKRRLRLILLWLLAVLLLLAAPVLFVYQRAWSDAEQFFAKQLNGVPQSVSLDKISFSGDDWVRFDFRLTHVGDVSLFDDNGRRRPAVWLLALFVDTDATWTLSEFGLR